jgi:hypothetical protein
MEIIRRGSIPVEQLKTKVFHCHYCGCIFRMTSNEYIYADHYNSSVAECPWCNRLVSEEGE